MAPVCRRSLEKPCCWIRPEGVLLVQDPVPHRGYQAAPKGTEAPFVAPQQWYLEAGRFPSATMANSRAWSLPSMAVSNPPFKALNA